jgi:hypothetical protein
MHIKAKNRKFKDLFKVGFIYFVCDISVTFAGIVSTTIEFTGYDGCRGGGSEKETDDQH